MVEYSRANIAKVNIFLKDPYVKRFIREEKISEFTFVGTVGGLLGLFLGFSFVSAVEIVYMGIMWLYGIKKSKTTTSKEEKVYVIGQVIKPGTYADINSYSKRSMFSTKFGSTFLE